MEIRHFDFSILILGVEEEAEKFYRSLSFFFLKNLFFSPEKQKPRAEIHVEILSGFSWRSLAVLKR